MWNHIEVIMAINVALDDQLIAEAMAVSDQKTKKAVVTVALQEYIARRKQLNIIKLFHTIDYDENLNHKQQRKHLWRN